MLLSASPCDADSVFFGLWMRCAGALVTDLQVWPRTSGMYSAIQITGAREEIHTDSFIPFP